MIRLKELRQISKMSQYELSAKTKLSQQTISKYENGTREPDISTLKQLASIFNVTVDYLIGYNSTNSNTPPTISEEESELLSYYAALDRTNQRWIMGQMIDLIKKADEKQTKLQRHNNYRSSDIQKKNGKIKVENVLGEKIRSLRISHNYTQDNLAKKLKISKSTIGMYEQNRRSPDLDTLLEIAHLFQVSVDFLLGNSSSQITNAHINLSLEDSSLLEYFHKTKNGASLTWNEKTLITKFFSYAVVLQQEEQELLEYYNELSIKDRRWIMGQMIDLIKKADEKQTKLPKAQ